MTQNESCDIRQLYVVELVVGSEQKLYFCVTIPIKTIVIERVRRVLPQQNTPSVKYNRVISRCMSLPLGYNGDNLVTTLAPSFLIGSSLFLQVTRTPIKSRMGSKFGSIQRRTYELAALERLEKSRRLMMGERL